MNQKIISKELARGGIIGIISYFFVKPMNLVTSVIIARYLGANDFGLYALGLSIIMVLNVLTNMGFTQGIVRYVSIYRSENNFNKVKGVFFASLFISLSIGLITTILLVIFANSLSNLFTQNKSLSVVLAILALGLPFNTLYVFMGAMAQAYKRVDYQNFIVNVARPVTYLLLVVLALAFNLKFEGILLANSVSTVLVSLIAFFILIKLLPQIKVLSIKPEYEPKKLLAFSLPTLISGLTAMVLLRIDRIMIGYYSTETSVGVYNAAANAAINIGILLIPFASIFSPIAAELYHLQIKDKLKKAFQDISRWLLIFTLPIFFLFISFTENILALFGKDFNAGKNVLIIISIAQLINVFTGPVGVVLKMSGYQKIDMYISFLVIIISVSLNIFLIPIYDMTGAAISTAVSICITNFLRMVMVYKLHKMWPYNKYTLKPIIVFIFLLLIFKLIMLQFNPELVIKLLTVSIIIAIYFLFIFLAKLDDTDYYILNILKKKFLFIKTGK